MKIRIDRDEAPPAMGLSVERTRRILALTPPEWLTDVSEIHITASLVPSNSRWGGGDASFSQYDRRLTIFARGHTWQELVVPILAALAAHHLALPRRRDHRLSEADAKRLSNIVAPYVKNVIAQADEDDATTPTIRVSSAPDK
jgi:hypothetical protein